MSPGKLFIQVLSRQGRFKIYRESVALFCAALLTSLGRENRTLSVAFIGARTMRALNRRYLERNYATDVLSFSYEGVIMEDRPFLGEILIAPEAAVHHATRHNACPERELRKLLVHGVLHLLGYDHETDRGQMKRLQARLMRRRFFMNSPALADLKANR